MLIVEGTGTIKAATSNVSDSSSQIAKFAGWVTLQTAFSRTARSEGERFVKDVYYGAGVGMLSFSDIHFQMDMLSTLWSITTNASGTLNDGSTAATTYTIGQSSKPQSLEILIQMTDKVTGKKIEIEAAKSYCEALLVGVPKNGYIATSDCVFYLLGDSSDNVVAVRMEN